MRQEATNPDKLVSNPAMPGHETDVGAVLLTLGEPTTGRALASLRCQSAPPRQPVIVDGVTPFHAALNEAPSASRRRSSFRSTPTWS